VRLRLVGSNPHSDKEKFCSDLNRPKSCKISEWVLKTLQKFKDFQAEYEGSIPFTRSKNDFNDLARNFKLSFWRHSDNFDSSRLKADANQRMCSRST
jgi:hypothetical protein